MSDLLATLKKSIDENDPKATPLLREMYEVATGAPANSSQMGIHERVLSDLKAWADESFKEALISPEHAGLPAVVATLGGRPVMLYNDQGFIWK